MGAAHRGGQAAATCRARRPEGERKAATALRVCYRTMTDAGRPAVLAARNQVQSQSLVQNLIQDLIQELAAAAETAGRATARRPEDGLVRPGFSAPVLREDAAAPWARQALHWGNGAQVNRLV